MAAGRGGKSHTFFSLWEKYPSEAKGDEGLVNRWETTATPSVAALLVPLEGDNAWAAGRGGKRHTFFSLWEKYPSEAMGDEGLVNSNAGS